MFYLSFRLALLNQYFALYPLYSFGGPFALFLCVRVQRWYIVGCRYCVVV